jgi:hypothetical protein
MSERKLKFIYCTKKNSKGHVSYWRRAEYTWEQLVEFLKKYKTLQWTRQELIEFKEPFELKIEEFNNLIKNKRQIIKDITKGLKEIQDLDDITKAALAIEIKEYENEIKEYESEKESFKLKLIPYSKDQGGFIMCDSKKREDTDENGNLKYYDTQGKRNQDIISRSSLTYDKDDSEVDDIQNIISNLNGYSYFVYNTFNSTPKHPRWRIVVPLLEDVTPDEFTYISKKFAEIIGITDLDNCCHKYGQVMYNPCYPKDIDPVFFEKKGELLDGKTLLVDGWNIQDTKQVKIKPGKVGKIKSQTHPITEKVLDKNFVPKKHPYEIEGIAGDFNRAIVDIHNCIDTYLSSVYTYNGQRYYHEGGTGEAGGIVFDANKPYTQEYNAAQFFTSHHHNSDNVSKLNNANSFELVQYSLFNGDYNKTREWAEKQQIVIDLKTQQCINEFNAYNDKIKQIINESVSNKELPTVKENKNIPMPIKDKNISISIEPLIEKHLLSFIESQQDIVSSPTLTKILNNNYNSCIDFIVTKGDKTLLSITFNTITNEICKIEDNTNLKNKSYLPDAKERYKYQIKTELKKVLTLKMGEMYKLNSHGLPFFFEILKPVTLTVANPGSGKSYEAMKKLIITAIFKTDELDIVFTNGIANVGNLEFKIPEIIKSNLDQIHISPVLYDYLNNFKLKSGEVIDIFLMTSTNVNEHHNACGIISHHTFLELMGHTPFFNNRLLNILNTTTKKINVIIDEYELFVKKHGFIQLNNFTKIISSIDSKDKDVNVLLKNKQLQKTITSNSYIDWINDYNKIDILLLPNLYVKSPLVSKHTDTNENGIKEYKPSLFGEFNLLNVFEQTCQKINELPYDSSEKIVIGDNPSVEKLFYPTSSEQAESIGWTFPFTIRFVNTFSTYKFIENKGFTCNFSHLLEQLKYMTVIETKLQVKFSDEKTIILDYNQIEEFEKKYFKNYPDLMTFRELQTKIHNKTSINHAYKKKLVYKSPCILDGFKNITPYYITGNDIKTNFKKDLTLKYFSQHSIKEITIINAIRTNKIDENIVDDIPLMLKNRPFYSLCVAGYALALKNKIKKGEQLPWVEVNYIDGDVISRPTVLKDPSKPDKTPVCVDICYAMASNLFGCDFKEHLLGVFNINGYPNVSELYQFDEDSNFKPVDINYYMTNLINQIASRICSRSPAIFPDGRKALILIGNTYGVESALTDTLEKLGVKVNSITIPQKLAKDKLKKTISYTIDYLENWFVHNEDHPIEKLFESKKGKTKNKLTDIVKSQILDLVNNNKSMTKKDIYNNLVKSKFDISERSFKNLLAENK